MGLDTSHDCWHGPYSSFMCWRIEVAKHIGVPLGLMEGFFSWEDITHDDVGKLKPIQDVDGSCPGWVYDLHRAVIGAPLPMKWKSFKPSALHILLDHSDCDGSLRWQDCDAIAVALEEILPLMSPDTPTVFPFREKTQQFIDGLRLAYKNEEDVEFH